MESQGETEQKRIFQTEEKHSDEKKISIHTYIHTLLNKTNKQTNTLPESFKVHKTLSVHSDIHEAAVLLAPFFKTTISDLYEEGLLRYLKLLVEQLPEDITLNIVQPGQKKKEFDAMLDLEADFMKQELSEQLVKLRKIKATSEWKDPSAKTAPLKRIYALLPRALRTSRRSGDPELERLVFEAREFLRK